MIIGDLLVEKEASINGLRSALASMFGVDREQVGIGESVEGILSPRGVYCQLANLRGQFRQQLSVYVADSVRPLRLSEVATALARSLDSNVLVPDDTPDPYVMMLVDPAGGRRIVQVDVERLDEFGEYHVVGETTK